jgi:hypothetical protein
MLVDWKAELKTPKGEPITTEDKQATLESISYELLLLSDPRAELSGGAKLKNARLAKKVIEGGEIDLEEVKIIRDLVGKYGSPAVVLAVEDLLDPPKE